MRDAMTRRQESFLDPGFLARNVIVGMAAFIAPIVAAASALVAIYRPGADIMKAVARMSHPDRLSLSAREAVLKDADEQGLDLTAAFDSIHLSDVERRAILHMLARERQPVP